MAWNLGGNPKLLATGFLEQVEVCGAALGHFPPGVDGSGTCLHFREKEPEIGVNTLPFSAFFPGIGTGANPTA